MSHYRRSGPCGVGLLAVACALASASSAASETFRVDGTNGADTQNCGSALSPCASIQQAVNLSSSGDAILVAAGTYTHQPAADPCTGETGVVCIVGKHLTVLGGYSPGNWSTADPDAHPTLIDGENLFRGILVKRSSPTSPSGASLVLDGFVLQNGRANGAPTAPEDRRGGGLKAALLESLVIRRVRFENNVAVGSDTLIEDGGNGVGGGLSISSAQSLPPTQVTLEELEFRNNEARGGEGQSRGGFALGGGVFVNRSTVQATDLLLESNTAVAGSSAGDGLSANGQHADALGGGMAILADALVSIQGLRAFSNTAAGGSSTGTGGVGAGGAVYVERAILEVHEGDIRGNSTTGGAGESGGLATGGGLTAFAASVNLDRVALIDNTATGGDGPTKKGSVGGGGAYLNADSSTEVTATVKNCIIGGNRIDLGAGGGTVGGGGAGLFVLGNTATVSHTTLAGNILGSDPLKGQAISVVPHPNGNPSHADLMYSIVADHTSLENVPAIQVRSGGGSAHFERGLFANNEENTNSEKLDAGTFSGLETMLIAPDASFVSPGAPNHDYHLVSDSPARDQAVGSTIQLDFDGNTRPSQRDIGADEYCSATFDNITLSSEILSGSVSEQACQTISASEYIIEATGDALFKAGSRVVLGDGFRVENGGRLQILIELP